MNGRLSSCSEHEFFSIVYIFGNYSSSPAWFQSSFIFVIVQSITILFIEYFLPLKIIIKKS